MASNNRPVNKFFLKSILLGDSGTGKTSLLYQYVHHRFVSQHKATIGVDFLTKDVDVDSSQVTFQIWDTAGQERFNSIGKAFYRGADCCIIVYDVNDLGSFQSIDKWREDFLIQSMGSMSTVGNNVDGRGSNIPSTSLDASKNLQIVLIGNKIDLVNQRVISQKKALAWCEANGNIPYFEVSAKDSTLVEKTFQDIARIIVSKMDRYTLPFNGTTPSVNPNNPNNSIKNIGDTNTNNGTKKCSC